MPCPPRLDLTELVPYNQYLWLFFEILEKYSPADNTKGIEASLRNLALAEAIDRSQVLDITTHRRHFTTYVTS